MAASNQVLHVCLCFGLALLLHVGRGSSGVHGHMNLYLNQHEVMRFLGKSEELHGDAI